MSNHKQCLDFSCVTRRGYSRAFTTRSRNRYTCMELFRFCFLSNFIPDKATNSYLSPTTGFSQDLTSITMGFNLYVFFRPIHTGEFDLVFPSPFNLRMAFFKNNKFATVKFVFDVSAFFCFLNRFILFAFFDFPLANFLNQGIYTK